MASTLEDRGSKQYVDFDEYIDYQLQKTRSNIKSVDVLTALAGVAALVIGYVLLFVVFDHWVIPGGFGYAARVAMLGALAVAAAGWVAWRVVIPYLRRVNRLYAARALEKAQPVLHGNLLNLVDLRSAGRPVSPDILAAIEKRAAVTIAHTDVDHAIDRRPLMRLSYALLALVVLFCGYTLFSPKKISNSVWRALFPASTVPVATRTEIVDVAPGDAEVIVRTHLEITADLRGEIPERVMLYYTTADRRFVDEPVELREVEDGVRRYRAVFSGENARGIVQDITYRIEAGDARTRDFQVTVLEPPTAQVDEVRYEYPDYMRLEPKTQPVGPIDAWEGTKVTILATANMPVASAKIVFQQDESLSSAVYTERIQVTEGLRLRGEFKLRIGEDGTYPRYYRIECRNERGDTDPDPALHGIRIRPDQRPDLTLVDPVESLERPANAVVPLWIQARDDFGLRRITLRIKKNGEELRSETIFDGPERKRLETVFDWRLEPLGLQPGDVLAYHLEARDNNPNGYPSTTTPLSIHIVDPVPQEEVDEQLEADRQRQDEQREEQRRDQPDLNEEGVDPMDQPDSGHDADPQPHAESDQADDSGEGRQPQDDLGEAGPEEQSAEARDPGGEGEGDGEDAQPSRRRVDDPAEALRKIAEHQERRDQDGDPAEDEEELRDPGDPQQEPQKQPNDRQPGDEGTNRPDRDDVPQEGEPGEAPDERQPPDRPRDAAGDESGERGAPEDGDGRADGQDRRDAAQPHDRDAEAPRPDSPQQGDAEPGPGEMADGAPDGGEPGDPQDDGPSRSQPEAGADSDQGEGAPGEPDAGRETPADPSDDARREKAEGDETGPATPDSDPDADPTPARNRLDREDGEDSAPTRQDAPDRDDEGVPRGSDRPRDADPAAPMTDRDEEPIDDDRRSAPSETDVDRDPAKTDGQPDDGSDDLRGEGRKEGQKADQSDSGEAGQSQQNDDGTTGGNERGPGDSGGRPGEQEAADQDEPGRPGEETGEGEQTRPAERDPDGMPPEGPPQPGDGAPGDPSDAEGEGDGAAGEGGEEGEAAGQPSGDAGDQPPSDGRGVEPGGGDAGQSADRRDGAGHGDGAPPAGPEDPDLEAARKAANLVLERLENELQRGEVDQKLLDELGWSKEELERFSDSLNRHLREGTVDDSPESLAQKRQLDEALRNFQRPQTASRRRGADVEQRRHSSELGPRRRQGPAEFQEWYEEYTRSLSGRSREE